MEVRVSLNDFTRRGHIDLAELIEHVEGISRRELVRLVEQHQDMLIQELCGPKYSRSHEYRRGSSYTKTLTTSVGRISFRVKRVIRRIDNAVRSPILEALDVKRKRYSCDVRMKCVDFASKMSYQDASEEFEEATGVHIPKRTIHSFVQQIAPKLLEASRASTEAEVVLGDSTEVRALSHRKMNSVHVLVSGSGQMLALEVNTPWPTVEAEVLISDNEPGLADAVQTERRQLCILHALRYILFTLWGEGMSRDERGEVNSALKHTLFTLVNSTWKHLEDGDKDRLQARINTTLTELRDMANRLKSLGYPKASAFLEKHAKFMVTFAELALEKGITIPYTANAIERLMGEVSKRCKHKWMHWSTEGLKNILTIALVRYTNRKLYKDFKKAYTHNEPII